MFQVNCSNTGCVSKLLDLVEFYILRSVAIKMSEPNFRGLLHPE